MVGLLADEGASPVVEWLQKCEAAAVPGTLQQGELMQGEYGLAKALLAAARGKGAARSIAALKGALPECLPRCVSVQQGSALICWGCVVWSLAAWRQSMCGHKAKDVQSYIR